jgi:hypothetical protein
MQGTKVKYTPVFVLSPTFAARNDVQTRSRFVTGSVPVTNLGLVSNPTSSPMFFRPIPPISLNLRRQIFSLF